ncbi:hypothetical protein BB561_005540 [Smittium simulii]|uniref:GPI transamidase subunit PIG-U n=1 Tax=Smittium simulii TaxID=133385 RepID=A0A2T9Y9V9_9FUNG|nr:hypothetical protein BB561_005540 [Smittium simulii]
MMAVSTTTIVVLLIGLVKFLFMQFADVFILKLSALPELSTPNTSYKNLLEGLFLNSIGISSYEGDVCHQSPLLIFLLQYFTLLPEFCINIFYILTDCYIAIILSKTAELKFKASKEIQHEKNHNFSSLFIAVFYLCNPYTAAIPLIKSTAIFEYAALASTIYSAMLDNFTLSALWLSTSCFLSFYSIVFVPAFALLISKKTSNIWAVIKFICLFALILALYYGVTIILSKTAELKFKASKEIQHEQNHNFSSTFIAVFYLCNPYTAAISLIKSTAIFEYAALASTIYSAMLDNFTLSALWLSTSCFLSFYSIVFVPAFALLISKKTSNIWAVIKFICLFALILALYYGVNLQIQYLSISLLVTGSILSLCFWDLWINLGTGNANFFYAASLVYNLGMIFFICDLGAAKLRCNIDMAYPKAKDRIIYQK